MASVTYRHKTTKQTATYAQRIRKLDKSDEWERVARRDTASEGPAKSATKDEWDAYAQSQGVDTEGMTKDQIIAAVS